MSKVFSISHTSATNLGEASPKSSNSTPSIRGYVGQVQGFLLKCSFNCWMISPVRVSGSPLLNRALLPPPESFGRDSQNFLKATESPSP